MGKTKVRKGTVRKVGSHFGEHYMLDGYLGNYKKLSNPARIVESISTIASVLGMTCAMEPVIKYVPGNGEKDLGGHSSFVIIYESHISVHAFPNQGFVSIDVYTCKNGMDTDAITKHFVAYFELDPKLVEVNFVIRGRGFSKYRTA